MITLNKPKAFNMEISSIVMMRVLLAFLMVAIIIVPLTTSAGDLTTTETWDNARGKLNAGTIGGVTIQLNDSQNSVSMDIEDFPVIVETYTATWCENCVDVEEIRDDAIGDTNVSIIHYHRHYFESNDPFGSNSTESRWESSYGSASIESIGLSRGAPTTIIDGERMHAGKVAKSDTLKEDFINSIEFGSSAPLYGSISLSATLQNTNNTQVSFSWETSNLSYSCMDDCQKSTKTAAWLMFVEDVAYFPEGSNGLEYYHHVLHQAIYLEESDGSQIFEVPNSWDGDDMSAILIVDWSELESEEKSIPAPSIILTVLCFLVSSLAYGKNNHFSQFK